MLEYTCPNCGLKFEIVLSGTDVFVYKNTSTVLAYGAVCPTCETAAEDGKQKALKARKK